MATGDAAQGVMSVEQAAAEIRQRLYLQSADVLGICTANTLHELRRHLNDDVLANVVCVFGNWLPEGKVYILTEGTLRRSLADWPQGDVLEIEGE